MKMDLKTYLKNAASFLWKFFMVGIDVFVAIMVPVYAGVGAFFLTIGVLDYSTVNGLLHTLLITSGGTAWSVMKVYKTRGSEDEE